MCHSCCIYGFSNFEELVHESPSLYIPLVLVRQACIRELTVV